MPQPETSRSSSGPARVRFGIFELDRANQVLYRNGAEVKLQPQPMAILLLLIERAPEEVSREEMQERIWPTGTFVEFEAAIATAVRKIRQALGDSAENPIFIKTAYRRGFRFIAPIQLVVPAPEATAAAPLLELMSRKPEAPVQPVQAPALVGKTPRPRFLFAGIAAAALIGLLLGVVRWMGFDFQPSPPPAVTPLTSFAGDEFWPSFSPDGTQVAFTWPGEKDDNVDIYIVEVGGHGLRRLTANPDRDQMPSWSPDGHWIAWLRNARAHIISPLGGPDRVVGVAHGDLLAWTPDSRELLMARPASNSYSLLAVSLATGDTRQILPAAEMLNVFQPVGYSGDGTLLAFARKLSNQSGPFYPRLAADQPTDLYVRDTEGGAARRLTRFAASMRGWTWIPGTHEIVFCSNQNGDFVLWRTSADRPDSDPRPVGITGPGCGNLSAARYRGDSNTKPSTLLAYEQRQFVLNLNTFETHSAAAAAARISSLLPSTRTDTYPRFSRDGRKLVFVSDRSGFKEIWSASASGADPVQVSSFGPGSRQLESPDFSPDGQEILYLIEDGEGRNFCALPANGGKPKRLLEAKAQELYASWSADGEHVYLGSLRSGSWQIWKLIYDRKAGRLIFPKAPLTTAGGLESHESPDGRYIYVLKPGVRQLWKLPVDGGAPPRVVLENGITAGWWFPAPGGVFFLDTKAPNEHLPLDTAQAIKFLDVSTGRQTPQATVVGRLYGVLPGLAVSPDGKQVVFAKVQYSNIDLSLVRDFR